MPDDNLFFLKKLIRGKANVGHTAPKTTPPPPKPKLCEHAKYSEIVTSMLISDVNVMLTQISLVRTSIAAILDEEVECKHRDPLVRKAMKIRLSKMAMIGQHLAYLRQELEDDTMRYKLLSEPPKNEI